MTATTTLVVQLWAPKIVYEEYAAALACSYSAVAKSQIGQAHKVFHVYFEARVKHNLIYAWAPSSWVNNAHTPVRAFEWWSLPLLSPTPADSAPHRKAGAKNACKSLQIKLNRCHT